jgi:hypothetical protein
MCDNARECAAAKAHGFGGPADGPAPAAGAGDGHDAGVHPPRSFADKLGIREGMPVVVAEGLDARLAELIRGAGAKVATVAVSPIGSGPAASQAALLQVRDRAGLGMLPSLRDAITRDGMLWVVWPKGVGEIGQGDVQRAGLDAGMVDVKVASISETLSGLKFVFRLRDR